MVGLNQRFHKIFVATNATPLTTANKTTTDLTSGQYGLFDGTTYASMGATPTYSTNKSFIIAQGTPDVSGIPKGGGIRNETDKTDHAIRGAAIVGWRGKKYQAGQQEIVTIGYDGTDTTKSMTGQCDEIKNLYIKLTGKPIENLFPGGTIRQYAVQGPCCDTCGDSCANIDPNIWVDGFISQINQDTFLGGIPITKFISITKLTGTDVSSNTVVGLRITGAFVEPISDLCYFDIFPYNADPVHIQVSEYNPDYHGSRCETTFPVTRIQEATYTFGSGQEVMRLEALSKMWDGRYYSDDLAIRKAEGQYLFTDPTLNYDQYVLDFDVDYMVLGWSNSYRDRYSVEFYFPTTTGTPFQAQINAYIVTIPNPLPTVTL